MFGRSSSRKRKNTLAQRVKKLQRKVAKKERLEKLKKLEADLKKKLGRI